ncbi:uncharacterized protein LOC120884495 [Ictidomys tridecemlineatus]
MLPNPQSILADSPAADSVIPPLEVIGSDPSPPGEAAATVAEAAAPPPPEEPGPAKGTRRRRIMENLEAPVMLPIRPYGPTIDDGHGEEMQAYQYRPFFSSDLYNWKNNNPPFSEDPTRLTGLVESLMFSHQPTWDDCQQLLGTLFTTEEQERILLEARKKILGPDGRPTQLPNIIKAGFPLNQPNWDPNTFEGCYFRWLKLPGAVGPGTIVPSHFPWLTISHSHCPRRLCWAMEQGVEVIQYTVAVPALEGLS